MRVDVLKPAWSRGADTAAQGPDRVGVGPDGPGALARGLQRGLPRGDEGTQRWPCRCRDGLRRPCLRRALPISATGMGPLPSTGAIAARRRRSHKDQASQPAKRESEAPQLLCLPADGQLCTTWARGAVDYRGTSARSSTDRASDYGSEGWGFESLRARPARPGQRPLPRLGGAFFVVLGATCHLSTSLGLGNSPDSSRHATTLHLN